MSSLRVGEKQQSDRLQVIIAEILKDDDNKYCADCDGKGPRWASWNLGILLCIRCAGIHRGLGVHISKVKSLNLDAWEPQQVAMLKAVGNRRGRLLYEANLPEYFRRPQTDSTIEQFIRSKYEQRRYVASDFTPPKPDTEAIKRELTRLEHQNKKRGSSSKMFNLPLQNGEAAESTKPTLKSMAKSSAAETGNILGLSPPPNSNPVSPDHFNGTPAPAQPPSGEPTARSKPAESAAFSSDLFGLQFGSTEVAQPPEDEKLTTKESILALYALSKPSAPSTFQASSGTGIGTTYNQMPSLSPPIYTAQPSTAHFDWSSHRKVSSATAGPADSVTQSSAQRFSPNWSTFTNGVTPSAPGTRPLHQVDVFSDLNWAHASSKTPAATLIPHSVPAPKTQPATPSEYEQSYMDQIQNQLASLQKTSRILE